MSTIEIDYDALRDLIGADESEELGDQKLQRDLSRFGLEYRGRTESGAATVDVDPDRPDWLSVEGIARSLRYRYGLDRGMYVPAANDAVWSIEAGDAPESRPRATGAVVRGVDLEAAALDSLVDLAENLDATLGDGRTTGAVGFYDLTMLKGERLDDRGGGRSVRYAGVDADPDADAERFVPVGGRREMTLAETLDHPSGEEYGAIVAGDDRYPAMYDEIGLFSFPPVVEGRRARVSTDSRELFVAGTGTHQRTIDRMLTVVCYAFDARGARIERMAVDYPDGSVECPDFSTRSETVTHHRVEEELGVDLDPGELFDLLERSGLGGDRQAPDETEEDSTEAGLVYDVEIPPYRVDIRGPDEVIDDLRVAREFDE
jgi:phenylalanyl-tRNA synthetase beta chain